MTLHLPGSRFFRVSVTSRPPPKPGALARATGAPDRVLANTAWNLWADYLQHAPLVVDELKKFWVSTNSSGTAVLVLDGLSARAAAYCVCREGTGRNCSSGRSLRRASPHGCRSFRRVARVVEPLKA